MNQRVFSLGETVWYDDAWGVARSGVVDEIAPDRVWIKIHAKSKTGLTALRGRVYFDTYEFGRLRDKKSRI